jgi:hypothetical protein
MRRRPTSAKGREVVREAKDGELFSTSMAI